MSARCMNDSCAIKWREVTTLSGPAYEANVDLDGGDVFSAASTTPTLDCGLNGLEVIVSPSAGNILAKHADGLYADQIGAAHASVANQPYVGIPATAVSGTDASAVNTGGYTSANPLGVAAVAVVTGTLEWFYTVSRLTESSADVGLDSNFLAYNAQMRGRLYIDDTGTFTVADKSLWLDISGIVKAADHQDKGSHQDFTLVQPVAAGGTMHLRADAAYVADSVGANQRFNVSFDVNQSNPARGFRLANIDVVWIPAA